MIHHLHESNGMGLMAPKGMPQIEWIGIALNGIDLMEWTQKYGSYSMDLTAWVGSYELNCMSLTAWILRCGSNRMDLTVSHSTAWNP